MNLLQLSCISSIVGALSYLIGDILIVGFIPNPEKYSLLTKKYRDKITYLDLSYLMLDGSAKRLMWGAIFGMIGTPFLFGSLYLQSYIFYNLPKKMYYVALSLSVISISISALAHSAFFFVGELYKLIFKCDVSSHESILLTGNLFTKMLYCAWYPAVFCGLIANTMITVSIFFKNSVLPKWAVSMNQILLCIIFVIIRPHLPKFLEEYLYGAAFNIASTIAQSVITSIVWNGE